MKKTRFAHRSEQNLAFFKKLNSYNKKEVLGAQLGSFFGPYFIQGEPIHVNGIEDVVGNNFIIWDILLVPGGLCERSPAGKQ